MTGDLQPSEVCHLLNYVLCRPIRNPQGHTLARPIDVCVVKSWANKIQRKRVTAWCERQLEVIPRDEPTYRWKRPAIVPAPIERFVLEQSGFKHHIQYRLEKMLP